MAKKPKDIWGISGQDVIDFMNRTVRTGQVASGDREALPGTADSYLNVREVGKAISQVNDLANPYANTTKQLLGMASGNPGAEAKFAKSLATETAILAAGVGIGKAAGVGVKAAQKSGLTARAYNAATGQKVLLSGRKTAGYKEIIAHGGKYSNDPELAKHAWTWFDNPQAPNYRAPKLNPVGSEALPFAHQGGTLYAVRGKSSSFVNQQLNPVNWETDTVVRSLSPQKVVGSIPIQHAGITSYQPQIQAMLKQAGFKFPKVVKK
jgi:hypothetical protein